MKLFGSKKKTSAPAKSASKKTGVVGGSQPALSGVEHTVLLSPRITEKAAVNAQENAYTFNVDLSATKNEIKDAVMAIYGVTPERVNTTPVRPKNVNRRQIPGQKSRGKKAYVYLKKGDSIEFM